MLYALNPTVVVRWVSLLTFLAAVGAVWVSSPSAAHSLWSAKSYVLAVPSGLVFLLTLRPVFRLVHGLTFARLWLFPMLDGDWEGDIHSNWPRIQAMMGAAQGAAPPFNTLTDQLPSGMVSAKIPIEAKIESGLLDFKITLTISRTRHSHTLFVKPVRSPERWRLYYVYVQREDGDVEVTDTRQHQGAAYLDFDASTGVLSGEYWTQRQGARGLNTAGGIRLSRKPPNRRGENRR